MEEQGERKSFRSGREHPAVQRVIYDDRIEAPAHITRALHAVDRNVFMRRNIGWGRWELWRYKTLVVPKMARNVIPPEELVNRAYYGFILEDANNQAVQLDMRVVGAYSVSAIWRYYSQTTYRQALHKSDAREQLLPMNKLHAHTEAWRDDNKRQIRRAWSDMIPAGL